MSKKIKVIIQTRLGSSRLPGKVLLKVLDKTILEYVIERVKRAHNIEEVIIATTKKNEDSKIVNVVTSLKVGLYRGSEDDVLDRYYQAACLYGAQHIVRITSDCPLIDPNVIDGVINHYFNSAADYCSNTIERTFPKGEDVEIFSIDALKDAWENASLLSEREHVTPFIWKNPNRFRLVNFRYKINLGGKRWTLDRKEDFEFIKAVLEALYPINPEFGMEHILKFLQSNVHLESINKGINNNEGYLKSLHQDKTVYRQK